MGTAITLSLNGITIDWRKNRGWTSHHWLFPPGSLLDDVEYRYADGIIKKKAGFQTTLDETYFRLCHLGYSLQETKAKFNDAVARWNRTYELRLPFSDFCDALTSVDFAALTDADLAPYIWDFRAFVLNLLAPRDTDDALLEDFYFGLDFALTLRVLAERSQSRPLLLRWHHQDLIESGWASLEDLTEVDRQTCIVNHTMLVGRLQDHAGETTVAAFDKWLTSRGVARSTSYLRIRRDGSVVNETTTLPTAVRNRIHHPENPHNALSDDDLRDSIEVLLEVAKGLPSPLPGLT